MTDVTQADREAAAEWLAYSPYDVVKAEAEMDRIGQLDNNRLVQAFARHRAQAESVGIRGAIIVIAKAAHAIGWQAGVGGRETAGAIVSYLATSPDEIGPFVAGELSPLDFAGEWMRGGCLTWHGADGKVWSPEEAAAARAAKTDATGRESPVD